MTELAGYAADGRLRAAVHTRLPLDAAAEAHRLLEARKTQGASVLIP
jgi:NADPH2:quinone reductase